MAEAETAALTGACGCGRVRFEVRAPLLGAVYCHCTRCQRRTGTAASASALAATGSLEVTAGSEALRTWAPADGFEKLFCGECGSALFGRRPGADELSIVRLGVFDGDPGVRPIARQFVAYAAEWELIPDDGLPRFAERMPLGSAPDTPYDTPSPPSPRFSCLMTARVPAAGAGAFGRYENAALALLADHGGRLARRLRTADSATEVHVVDFPTRAAFEGYLGDPRRDELQPLLAESGASVELLELYEAAG